MRRFASGLVGTALAASVAIASAMPLNAAPVYVPKPAEVSTDIEKVHYVPRRYKKKRYGWRYYRYRDRCYYNPYYCRPRYYGFRRHYDPYYPHRPYPYWRHRGWGRGGVTLELSF